MRALLLVLATLAASALPVAAQDPTASYTIDPAEPEAGDLVTFTSTSTPGASPIVSWAWDFGDGATGEGEVATHTYAAGDWVLTLVVTDADGGTAQTGGLLAVPEPATAEERITAGSTLPHWLFWVMPLLVALVLFSMAYLVVAKGQPAIYNLVFLLFYVTAGLKSLSEAGLVMLIDSGAQAGLLVANRVLGYLLAALFLWFVLVFPRPIVPWLRDGRRGALVLLLAVPFLALDLGDLAGFGGSENLLNVFAVTVAVTSLGLLYWHSRETDSQEEKLRIRWLAATFLLLVASTVVLTVLNLLYSGAIVDGAQERAEALANLNAITALIVVPALEIVGALILLYAILRFQALGIEGLVLRITRGAVTALTVPSLFITIGNSLEAVFEATVLSGVKFSFIVAGFISALLMIPVQKWITFLLHRYLPALSKESEHEAGRRREIFEAQLRYCLLDGALKPAEVHSLRRLAGELGMPRDEMHTVLGRFKGADLGGLVELKAPAS